MNRLGLKTKFVLHSVWILTALGAAVTLYSVSQLRDLLYQEMISRVEAQALNWIEANTPQIVLSDDRQTLERLLRELKRREKIAYVDLRDSNGISRAGISIPRGLTPRQAMLAPNDTCMHWSEVRDTSRSRYFELTACISMSGTGMSPDLGTLFGAVAGPANIGELSVGVDRSEFDRGFTHLVLRNVGLAAIMISVAIGFSVLFANRMVTPIASMGKVANQIAAGNLLDRVLQCGGLSDELGELVCNFNRMASRLEANRDEMNVLYSRLEDKVRERTSELEIANRKLRESDRQKSEFLATVSHELRTPLTSITAYAEILLDSGGIEPEKRARFLSIINTEAGRMSRLITDLLNLERIENGMARWRASAFDLREMVKAAAAVLGPALAEKRMHLTFTMPEAQPVLADADRIQEVLTNLLGNALKFCRPNGHIGIALQHVSASGPGNAFGDYVRIEVIDDGPGVPPEDRDQIFEKFYQGADSRGRHSGVGLGLAISREIILHHNGEIWLELPQIGGTVFCFTLPRHSTAIEFQGEVLQESYRPA